MDPEVTALCDNPDVCGVPADIVSVSRDIIEEQADFRVGLLRLRQLFGSLSAEPGLREGLLTGDNHVEEPAVPRLADRHLLWVTPKELVATVLLASKTRADQVVVVERALLEVVVDEGKATIRFPRSHRSEEKVEAAGIDLSKPCIRRHFYHALHMYHM